MSFSYQERLSKSECGQASQGMWLKGPGQKPSLYSMTSMPSKLGRGTHNYPSNFITSTYQVWELEGKKPSLNEPWKQTTFLLLPANRVPRDTLYLCSQLLHSLVNELIVTPKVLGSSLDHHHCTRTLCSICSPSSLSLFIWPSSNGLPTTQSLTLISRVISSIQPSFIPPVNIRCTSSWLL